MKRNSLPCIIKARINKYGGLITFFLASLYTVYLIYTNQTVMALISLFFYTLIFLFIYLYHSRIIEIRKDSLSYKGFLLNKSISYQDVSDLYFSTKGSLIIKKFDLIIVVKGKPFKIRNIQLYPAEEIKPMVNIILSENPRAHIIKKKLRNMSS